jgi:hypothetical protein
MMAEKELRIIQQSFISSSSLTSFESFERIKKELEEPGQSTDDTQNWPGDSTILKIKEIAAFRYLAHSIWMKILIISGDQKSANLMSRRQTGLADITRVIWIKIRALFILSQINRRIRACS